METRTIELTEDEYTLLVELLDFCVRIYEADENELNLIHKLKDYNF